MALCNSSRDSDVLHEPVLIGPLVVCTKRVELHGIPYVLHPISMFVDLSVEFQNLSDAVRLGSLRLLNHIADRDDRRWTSQQRSPMRRKSYKQQQLSDAIRIAIANGNFHVLKWLCTMYFREGYIGAELLELVVSLEALEVIEWLFAKFPEQTALPSGGLWQVAYDGCFDVVQWWWANQDRSMFITEELGIAITRGPSTLCALSIRNRKRLSRNAPVASREQCAVHNWRVGHSSKIL